MKYETQSPVSYSGLNAVDVARIPHLGGNFVEGDPFTFAPEVWNYVIDRLSIASVLDLGSGLGYSANYFFRQGCKVIAVDGLESNCQRAVYPTVQCDLTKFPVLCSVDLVHCQEVVEHIEEQHLDNVLSSLACGKFILMTHATPNQGGHHHVNEQLSQYWIDHLASRNYTLMEEDTARIRQIARAERAVYLAHNALLFSRGY